MGDVIVVIGAGQIGQAIAAGSAQANMSCSPTSTGAMPMRRPRHWPTLALR